MAVEKYKLVLVNTDGFFLKLNFKDADPQFNGDVTQASHYSKVSEVEKVMDILEERGFNFKLEIKNLKITYLVESIESELGGK